MYVRTRIALIGAATAGSGALIGNLIDGDFQGVMLDVVLLMLNFVMWQQLPDKEA